MINPDPTTALAPSDEFIEQVRSALKNLTHVRALTRHPLTVSLGYGAAHAQNGQRLRRELITTIETFNPSKYKHHPVNIARMSRTYTLLKLHYVDGMKLQNIANRLGISLRQAYRDLSAACREVSELIWVNHAPSAQPRADNVLLELAEVTLESESSPIDIQHSLGEAMKVIQDIVAQRAIQHTDEDISPTATMSCFSPAVVQQLFLSLFGCAVQAAHTDPKWVTSLTYDGGTWQFSFSESRGLNRG